MDICVLNPYFYPYNGGTEKVLLEVYKRLAKNHNITVITSSVGSSVGKEEFNGINIVRLKSKQIALPHLPLPLLKMCDLSKELKSAGADIYHINNRYQYFRGTINAIKKTGGKLAVTIHNSLPIGIDTITDYGGLLYDVFWGRRIMKNADVITAVSKNALDVTVPKKFSDKSFVIPNGIDYSLFKPINEKEKIEGLKKEFGFKDGVNIITNGRLTKQKGHIYLLKAISELNLNGNYNLTIIGKGPMEIYTKNMAMKLGIDDKIRIINGIEEEKLPYYYSCSDVFVFPSLYEPAGVALLEALACGIPTIATKIGGIPEVLDGYGEYIKIKDSKVIADAVKKVSSDFEHYKGLSLACRKNIIEKEHDWDIIAKRYEEVFENACRA